MISGRSGELRSAPRIGRGAARSIFDKIELFRFGDRFGIDFAPPEASLGSSLALLGSSLGCLGRSWGAPGRVYGRPRGFLGRLLERSWALWEALRDAKGSQGAPATDLGVMFERFSNDFEWISPPQFAHELDFGKGDTALSMWQNKPNFLQRQPCGVAA